MSANGHLLAQKGRRSKPHRPMKPAYFGTQVLVLSFHLLSAIFSHSACVAGVVVV